MSTSNKKTTEPTLGASHLSDPKIPPHEIMRLLEKTGFTHEAGIGRTLREHGFSTLLNETFLDPDEKKAREIDVIANKTILSLDQRSQMTANLLIGCKRAEAGVTVIGSKKTINPDLFDKDLILTGNPIQINIPNPSEFHRLYTEEKTKTLEAFSFLKLKTLYPAFVSDVLGVQVARITSQSPGKAQDLVSGLGDFFLPIAKATKHFASTQNYTGLNISHWTVNIPIVVINGPIWFYDNSLDKPELHETTFATIKVETTSNNSLIRCPIILTGTLHLNAIIDKITHMLNQSLFFSMQHSAEIDFERQQREQGQLIPFSISSVPTLASQLDW